jgi:hypothetical protein
MFGAGPAKGFCGSVRNYVNHRTNVDPSLFMSCHLREAVTWTHLR